MWALLLTDFASLKNRLATYQSVLDFLDDSNPATDGGLSAVKPLLVCGDSWVIRQTLNDQALNIDGMDRVIRITNKNGEPVLLGDDENYSIIVEENTAKLARQIFLVSRLLETQACILNYADGWSPSSIGALDWDIACLTKVMAMAMATNRLVSIALAMAM
jgi:hypothetical protein